MKEFTILADGLAFQYDVKAKNRKEAFKTINSMLKGELNRIIQSGGEVAIY